MNHRVKLAVAAMAVAFVVGGIVAQAAPVSVTIGFPFVAAGKTLPAGKYQIDISTTGPVVIRGEKGNDAIMAVLTRLGRHDKDTEPELIFDRVGEALHLSEVWLPGEDGYLLVATKEKHGHVVVGGPMGKK